MKHLSVLARLSIFIIAAINWSLVTTTTASEQQLVYSKMARSEVARELKFTGTIEAVNQGTASAQTSGRVIETLVDVGDLVAKDDVILRLRDTQQQANLQTAQAGVNAAQAQFDSAEKEFQRIQEIRSRELVSQSVADNALASRDSARANLEAAKGRLKEAEEQLEFTRIRAPYSGIVLERHVEVGETVNPGTPLYTGMSLERLRVLTDVPQKDINAIRDYRQARIQVAENTINITADDLTFFGYADPQTSTFRVRADLPSGTEGLYPGMYIAINFQIGVAEALLVPVSAVVQRDEVTAVYIKRDNAIEFRQIKTGREHSAAEQERKLEVLSGLKAGDEIVLNPAAAITWIKNQSVED